MQLASVTIFVSEQMQGERYSYFPQTNTSEVCDLCGSQIVSQLHTGGICKCQRLWLMPLYQAESIAAPLLIKSLMQMLLVSLDFSQNDVTGLYQFHIEKHHK